MKMSTFSAITFSYHFKYIYFTGVYLIGGFSGSLDGKESSCNAGDLGSIPLSRRSLEKGVAAHSNTFVWRIPWTEEPGGYSPWGLKELDTKN